jgi:hypothetical protein
MPVQKFHRLARSSCQPLLFARPPLPAAITVFHCNRAASCSRPLPHTHRCRCMLLHTHRSAARCCTHAPSAAHCCKHTSCLPSIAIVPSSAAACGSTHARCLLSHPCRRCCILLHARPLHHCSRHHCHLRRCWCHVH